MWSGTGSSFTLIGFRVIQVNVELVAFLNAAEQRTPAKLKLLMCTVMTASWDRHFQTLLETPTAVCSAARLSPIPLYFSLQRLQIFFIH
jgi:hypothetical protein